MRLLNQTIIASIALVFVACANPKAEPDLTLITVGMTKDEVTTKIGKPTRVAVQHGLEVFEYEAYDEANRPFVGLVKSNYRYLFVRFLSGKVESFGRKGDFDSTKNPTSELKIDQKITGGSAAGGAPPPEKFDLASELQKLEQMKKDGLLNEDEYKQLRQRAIDKAKAQ